MATTAPAPTINPIISSLVAIADAALTQGEVEIVPLTGEGLALFKTVLLPKMDVPAFLVPLISGEAKNLATPLDAYATAELELVRARLNALL